MTHVHASVLIKSRDDETIRSFVSPCVVPVLLNSPRIRFAEKGYTEGEDVYAAFGQTFGRRYLSVFFVFKPNDNTAIIICARDMSQKERKSYARK